jgi:hypothetical protein
MKKINLTLLVLFIGLSSMAQYKKASYFGKDGRTFGFGTHFYALGNGSGTPRGYYLSIGVDKDGKQLFTWYEFQYLPSYNFQFNTSNHYGNNVTTYGTSKGSFIYGYNLGYFLLKNENDKRRIKPYLTAGMNVQFIGGVKETSGADDDAKVASDPQFSVGLGGGAGFLLNFTPWLALQTQGGYSFQMGVSTASSGQDTYYVLPSHPYVSVGLRFRVAAKN